MDIVYSFRGSCFACKGSIALDLTEAEYKEVVANRSLSKPVDCPRCGYRHEILYKNFQEKPMSKQEDVFDVDFNPLWDYCLLEQLKTPESKTPGGIVIPDTNKTLNDLGKCRVIKAGPGVYKDNGTFVENPLKPGDLVYRMTLMKAFHVIIKGKAYLCSAGRDIVATAKEED